MLNNFYNQQSLASSSVAVLGYDCILTPSFAKLPTMQRISEQTYSTSFDQIVKKWKDSFVQLRDALDIKNYNANVILPSDITVSIVTYWLRQCFDISPTFDAPDIMPDGSGGLDIEWYFDDKFLSIHIDHVDKNLNRIFVKKDGRSYSKSLSKKNLQAELSI